MKTSGFFLVVLTLGALAVFSAVALPPQLKIDRPLGVSGSPDCYNIPVGSAIIHLANGATKIIGPDGALVAFVTSDEVGFLNTPGHGPARADHVYEVPSGSFVHGASANTTEIYDVEGRLVLTVIDEAGDIGAS